MPTILVVDDEPVVLRVVSRTLQLSRYHVLAAASAEEALQLANLHAGRIELLIVDHSAFDPEGNLARIRAERPGVRLLRYSGDPESEVRESGDIPPDSFFLQKPFRPSQLLDLVRQAIGEAEPNPER